MNAVPLGEHRGTHATLVGPFVRQLGEGRASIRSSYAIAAALGVNQRAVGYIAREARLQGFLVGSAHGRGYYLIADHDELTETIEHLETRARGIAVTVRALRRSWRRRGVMPGTGAS